MARSASDSEHVDAGGIDISSYAMAARLVAVLFYTFVLLQPQTHTFWSIESIANRPILRAL